MLVSCAVAVISIISVIMAWYNYGVWATFYIFAIVYGLRRAFSGQDMGKRMFCSAGLIWCLQTGWIWSSVIFVFIWMGGFVLKSTHQFAQEQEAAEQAAGGGQSAAPGGSPESKHGAGKKAKGKK